MATAANVAAAGWSGIAAGAAFMLCASAVILAVPHQIAHLFTPDPGIVAAAVPLLAIAAGFQFFDGIQINAAGALRGAGDTATSFYTQIFAYWVLGMPLGLYLGFHRKLGAVGLGWGLLVALAAAAAVLLYQWQKTALALQRESAEEKSAS
jgi:MATE family multidrug resistance protein